MNHDSPILLHIPHAAISIPESEHSNFCLPDLKDELLKMTDRYCDELFTGYDSIVFPISRLACDPERFRNDAQESMARVGMGAVYTRTSAGELLRCITAEERERLLRQYYDPHHARLTAAAAAKLRVYGRCLIVDGHSFHPVPLPYEPDQRANRPDFCIGTDAFHTPPALVQTAVCFLRENGHSVELNRPFSGCMVPLPYYQKDRRISSIMIEVNRRLYMKENGKRSESFERTRRTLRDMIDTIAAEFSSL